MVNIIKQLWLICTLIALASLALLLSDLEQRPHYSQSELKTYPAIAIMQITSTNLLDSHVKGVVDRLQEAGFLAPDKKNLHIFNPQSDISTANAIASELANGPYEIIITSSTIALQVFANANRTSQKKHVFGAVTNPYTTGVGITGPEPTQHPPYLAGVGTFQPVKAAVRLAHEMNPELQRLGVVWNSSEQSSEACLIEARAITAELNINLIEAIATNTSEVYEATQSLIAKKVDAIWIGGDVVATASIDLIIKLATQAGIPVFTNDPTDADKGAIFGLGADYATVGKHTANIAIAILNGASPGSFRIDNDVPELLKINNNAIKKFHSKWKVTAGAKATLTKQNDLFLQNNRPIAPPGKSWHIGLSYIVPAPIFDYAIQGFKDGLADLGFIEGKNIEITIQHANGDLSFLPQATTNLVQLKPDLLVAMSTPSLGSAIAHSNGMNIVFGIVSAPLEAGAGKSFDNHLPNVTGIVQMIPTEELFDWTQKLFPKLKRIGVLYNPSEANSVKEVADIRAILNRRGIELETVAVNTTSEVPENILGLLARKVDLVFAIADNTIANGMPAIIRAAQQQNIPVIGEDIALMGSGALFSCAPGPYSDGRDIAELAARVLLGQSPAEIPITPGKKNELTVDLTALQRAGIKPPIDLLQRADRFFNVRSSDESPAKIVLVNLVDNPLLTKSIDGVKAGIIEMGLREGRDFQLKQYSAQGDITLLPQMFDRAVLEKPDVIVTVTTPALIAGVRKNLPVPLVFTVSSNPLDLKLFKQGRPPNITGIHDDPPLDQVLAMAKKANPQLTSVGILYDAAESNSLISVERLRTAGKTQKIQILEATVNTVSDMKSATQSLIQRGASAIILSADNLVSTGFPAILQAARHSNIPIFTTDIDLVEMGADGGVGDNYFEWGRHSGHQVAKVIAGIPPSELPIQPNPTQIRIEPKTSLINTNKAHKPWKVRMVLYSETEFAERSREGMLDAFKNSGLKEGRDFELRSFNAQGDISTLSSIMTNIRSEQVDLLMLVSTPTLQAALRNAGDNTRIVFSGVGDAVKAGAGKTESEHRPNVSGITTRSPFNGMARIIKETLPGVRRVGTLFTPGEINSVLYKDWFKAALEKQGIELLAIPVTSSTDIAQSAIELTQNDIQVVAQIVDNLTRPGFALIARKAEEKNLPVYVFDTNQMQNGGVIALARDYYDAGLEAGGVAVSVLQGKNLQEIPFKNTSTEKFVINKTLAQRYQLTISAENLQKATFYPSTP